MKAENQKTLGLVSLIIIALLCVPLMWFTLGGGNATSTGWVITPRIDNEGEYLGESVIFEVEGRVSAIYLNVGDVYNTDENGGLSFTLDFRSSSSSVEEEDYIPGLRKQFSIFSGGARNYGWVKLCDGISYSEKYVKLTTEQSFELKEVAFTDKDGKQLNAKCYGGYTWKGNSRKFITAEEDGLKSFSLTADEQGSFGASGVNALTYKEAEMLGAITNFIAGKGYHVSATSGPLGVELLSLGVLLVGENSFGLRLIPFIFFVASIYLMYFLAKKLFGSHVYAVVCASAFLLSGIALSIGGLGLSYSPAMFFAIASIWFVHKLWCDGISARVHEWAKSVLMATLFLTFAVLCDLTALILAPMLLITYWALFVRALKIYRKTHASAEGLEREYARERLSKTIGYGILVFLVCFIALPLVLSLMSYLLAFPSYSGYYKTQNPFVIMAKNFAYLYNAQDSGYFFGWILGLGSQKLSSFSNEVYLATNKAFTLISTLLVASLGVILLLNSKKKLANGELIVAVRDNHKTITYLLASFVLCYLSMLIFVGKNQYNAMAYLSVVATLAVTCFVKLISKNMSNTTNKAIVFFLVAITVLFFGAQFVCFTQIPIDQTVAKYLFGWTL